MRWNIKETAHVRGSPQTRGYIHQTVASIKLSRKKFDTSYNNSVAIFSFEPGNNPFRDFSVEFNPTKKLYKHHNSASLSSFDIYRTINVQHYTWTTIIDLCHFANIYIFLWRFTLPYILTLAPQHLEFSFMICNYYAWTFNI